LESARALALAGAGGKGRRGHLLLGHGGLDLHAVALEHVVLAHAHHAAQRLLLDKGEVRVRVRVRVGVRVRVRVRIRVWVRVRVS